MKLSSVAYHGEVGREATAGAGLTYPRAPAAYHGEIGREATAGSHDDDDYTGSLPRGNR